MATTNQQKVSCKNCIHAKLHRYGNNPILAACECQPQPYDDKFPFAIEVACVMRNCRKWAYDPVEKEVEQRSKVA